MSARQDKDSHGYVKGSCVYCGQLATTKDHVPPTNVVKRFGLSPADQVLALACFDCNRLLSAKVFLMTVPARKAYVRQWGWKKRLHAALRPDVPKVWMAWRDHSRAAREPAVPVLR